MKATARDVSTYNLLLGPDERRALKLVKLLPPDSRLPFEVRAREPRRYEAH